MKRAFVFLDLDDTILDFHKAERNSLRRTMEELGYCPTPEQLDRYSVINIGQWEKLEQGLLTRDEVLVSRYELWLRELGLDFSASEVTTRYEGHLHEGYWLVPGAAALLERLQDEYALYVASNGVGAVQASRISGAGIRSFFDGIFISEELSANKPDPGFFRACFARIPGFDPKRAIMVGDSLTSDILGGINAGIATCWFNPKQKKARPDIRADYEIRSLDELPGLLDRLF